MDVYCPRCGEPWDHDELHEVYYPDSETHVQYDEAVKMFQKLGCRVFGSKCSEHINVERAEQAKVLYDLLGDDMDGAASTFDDFGT